MKKLIKKVIYFIFGSDDSIMFKLNCSLFITAIIFFILMCLSYENHDSASIFTIISAVVFSIWMNTIQRADSVCKFVCEIIRLYMFFMILIFCLFICLNFVLDYNSVNPIFVYLSCVGLLSCSFYFVSKLISILDFIKKFFSKIKAKIFNTTDPAPSKIKALIENVTAFLVAIGGLTVAIKVITESIFQVMNYFI